MGETTIVPPATAGINGLDDLRPGDLLFTNIGGFVPGVLPVAAGMLLLGKRVRIGRVKFDHVAIVVEAGRPRSPGVPGFPDGKPSRLPRAVQAMPEGAEEIALTPERHWGPQTVYARLPEDWPGQFADAAAIARLMVAEGVDYSFASYVALAAQRFDVPTPHLDARISARRPTPITLPHWSNGPAAGSGHARGGHLPVEAICSQLADQALTLAGKTVMHGVKPLVVTPGDLALQLWRRPGVVWGGEGILG